MEKIQIRSASPIEYTLSTIGGKWKPNILFLIQLGINRFGLLNKGIHDISKQMLTKQLREFLTGINMNTSTVWVKPCPYREITRQWYLL